MRPKLVLLTGEPSLTLSDQIPTTPSIRQSPSLVNRCAVVARLCECDGPVVVE